MGAAHSHSHDHGHSPGNGHSHHHGADERRLGIAALLTGGFMAVEIVGGLISGSLALLADAGHMATDFAALALAWLAFRAARRPPDARHTYGFDRFAVLAGFVNGITLFAVAGFIVIEAIRRLADPVEIMGLPMLAVAAAGLAVNAIVFAILHAGDRHNLNMRGAMVHVLGDILGSAAAILAALVILATGWSPIDPLLSILVALLITRSAWLVTRDAGRILLEAAPLGLDTAAVAADLIETVEGVEDVHHVHAWCISEDRVMMTLHARVAADLAVEPERVVAAIKTRLHQAFGIAHATVEIERHRCADVEAA